MSFLLAAVAVAALAGAAFGGTALGAHLGDQARKERRSVWATPRTERGVRILAPGPISSLQMERVNLLREVGEAAGQEGLFVAFGLDESNQVIEAERAFRDLLGFRSELGTVAPIGRILVVGPLSGSELSRVIGQTPTERATAEVQAYSEYLLEFGDEDPTEVARVLGLLGEALASIHAESVPQLAGLALLNRFASDERPGVRQAALDALGRARA